MVDVVIRFEYNKDHAISLLNAIEPSDDKPMVMTLMDFEKHRSNAQNRLYWTKIGHLQKYALVEGRHKSQDYWHAYNAFEFLEPMIIQHPKTGMDMQIPRSTKKLGSKVFSEYMIKMDAHWAEHGIILPSPEDERY